MAKGRKRKSGQRKPSGDISRGSERDMGALMRIRFRQAVMGDAGLSPDFPLSILLARGKIDREQHDAGMAFGALYVRTFGSPHASILAWGRMIGENAASHPSEMRDARSEASYAASLATLDKQPDPFLARQLVHQLAVYLRRDWFVCDVFARQDRAERHRKRHKVIRQALQALADMDPVRVQEGVRNPLGIAHKGEPMPRVA